MVKAFKGHVKGFLVRVARYVACVKRGFMLFIPIETILHTCSRRACSCGLLGPSACCSYSSCSLSHIALSLNMRFCIRILASYSRTLWSASRQPPKIIPIESV
jgi:hypothetical protein